MEEKIRQLTAEFKNELSGVKNMEGLESSRIKYFGKKVLFTVLLRDIGNVEAEQRKEYGRLINAASNEASRLFEEKKQELETQHEEIETRKNAIDITLPGSKIKPGRAHPVTQTMEKVKEIFVSMGFFVAEGPEVETTYYNFKALNMPENHPARDNFNSFFLNDDVLLRTHTSPVQIRVMEKRKPPIAVIVPGKCYRRDAIDASHSPMFHQVEGLYVDKNVTFGDLKGVLEAFVKKMFGSQTQMRLRPSYFPFTEPSAEVDIQCVLCKGKGCQLCKKSGWLEIMGCGMVNPEVFKYVGYDPAV